MGEVQSLRSLSILYSSSTLRKILSEDNFCAVEGRLLKHKSTLMKSTKAISFGDFLTSLYAEMSHNYCNEYIYKNSVFNALLKKYTLESTTLLNEFKIGKSIADLLFINGEVKVFELKTELDTLARLDFQLKDYRKAVEKIYIVVSQKHLKQICDAYNDSNFGIIELLPSQELKYHKEAKSDKSGFEHEIIFKVLRKNEYSQIINNKFGFIPNVPNTLFYTECLEIAKKIPIDEFQASAFAILKERKLNAPDLLLSPDTPVELKFLCHSLDLKVEQYNTLFQLLNKKI